jgi:predicted ATPase/class 3 adenylate cyclase
VVSRPLLAAGWFSYAVAVEMFTFLFTDIEGSTALLQRLGGDVYAQVLADHHTLIRSALAAHGGREIDTAGDGFFAEFSSPRGCIAAAAQMQQALAAQAWPGDEPVRVRMGVHCGEAEQTGTGLVGLDVHRAARIAAVAHGGQVLVSETAAAMIRDALPAGAVLRDLGVHRLKDLGRPERILQLCGPGLEADFGPLRSLGNPALLNNLPAELAAFIGRDRELAEVRALVDGSRLVTLTGAGGSGKTRLGLQVAADLLDGSPDGVWLVELATVTSEDGVPAAIAGTLRIPAQPARPVLDVLADALAPQDMFIVLDNCEHLIGGCAKTAEALLLRCPKVHVIATSREQLGIGGEVIYRVPSLSLPAVGGDLGAAGSCDAVALLADRAWAHGVSLAPGPDTIALMVSLCRQLDGMPLAIELAAARLRSMSLTDLHDRLEQRFLLLTGGRRTALERQQTLRAAIGWSYSLLTAPEQALLARLSVFAGGFDLAAAEVVCGFGPIDPLEVAGLLGSLADKSLVVTEPAGNTVRYRLLETIRLFAAERLAAAGEEAAAARAAHCAHYLAVAETAAPHLAGPQQASWLSRLDAEEANLRRAAGHAAGDPDGTSLVLRFGVALWRYWSVRFRNEEAAGLLVPVLRRPEAASAPALLAEAMVVAALFALHSDASASLQFAEEADEIAGRLGDNRLRIMSLRMLCSTYYFAGDLGRARRLGQQAVERARELGDDVLLGWVLFAYASAVGAQASGPLYAEAITCTERSGDLRVNAHLHNAAGWAALEMGDIRGARSHVEAAIRAAGAIGDPYLPALASLGELMRAEGDLDGARSTFEEVVRIGRRTGDKYALVGAIHGLACLAADVGDSHRATILHAVAQAMLDRTGVSWEPFDARLRQESLDKVRQTFSGEQFQYAYAQGLTLSFDQAIDFAIGRTAAVDSQQATGAGAVS